MEFDIELEKAVAEIKGASAKTVLIQLPDGLKPRAKEITDTLREKTDAQVLIWAGSCFGACDTPYDVEKLGVDMILAWGHSPWRRAEIR